MFQTSCSSHAVQMQRRCAVFGAVLLLCQGAVWAGGRPCQCDDLLGRLQADLIPQKLQINKQPKGIVAAHQIGTRPISALAFIGGRCMLAVAETGADKRGGEPGRLMFLDLATEVPKLEAASRATDDMITCFAVAPYGNRFAIGGARWDRSLALWDHTGSNPIQTWKSLPKTDCWMKAMQFSENGNLLATATSDSNGPVQLWEVSPNLGSLEPRKVLPGPAGALSAVAFSPGGRFLAAGLGTSHRDMNDGRLLIWNVTQQTAELVCQSNVVPKGSDQTYDLTAIMFTEDGKTLVTGDQRGMIQTWSFDANGQIALNKTIVAHAGGGLGVQSLAPVGNNSAVSSGSDGTVKLWNLTTGESLRTWDFGTGSTVLTQAPARPDFRQRHFAVGLASGAVYILRLDTFDFVPGRNS